MVSPPQARNVRENSEKRANTDKAAAVPGTSPPPTSGRPDRLRAVALGFYVDIPTRGGRGGVSSAPSPAPTPGRPTPAPARRASHRGGRGPGADAAAADDAGLPSPSSQGSPLPTQRVPDTPIASPSGDRKSVV